jgi:PIN domain nuclease of toxin-antitoxin system
MSRILLDTNALIFALVEPFRLPEPIADLVRDTDNEVIFSAASIWEIAIKTAMGRASFKHDPTMVTKGALETGFSELPIRSDAAIVAAALPVHHKDPFDRILIGQAIVEQATLLTSDSLLSQYSALVHLFEPL